jgi:hypothetical protein
MRQDKQAGLLANSYESVGWDIWGRQCLSHCLWAWLMHWFELSSIQNATLPLH